MNGGRVRGRPAPKGTCMGRGRPAPKGTCIGSECVSGGGALPAPKGTCMGIGNAGELPCPIIGCRGRKVRS